MLPSNIQYISLEKYKVGNIIQTSNTSIECKLFEGRDFSPQYRSLKYLQAQEQGLTHSRYPVDFWNEKTSRRRNFWFLFFIFRFSPVGIPALTPILLWISWLLWVLPSWFWVSWGAVVLWKRAAACFFWWVLQMNPSLHTSEDYLPSLMSVKRTCQDWWNSNTNFCLEGLIVVANMFRLKDIPREDKFSLHLFIIMEYLLRARYYAKWCTDIKAIRAH